VIAAHRDDSDWARPPGIPTVTVHADADGVVRLPALIGEVFGMSRSQARKALAADAARLDGEKLALDPLDMPAEALIEILRRRPPASAVGLAHPQALNSSKLYAVWVAVTLRPNSNVVFQCAHHVVWRPKCAPDNRESQAVFRCRACGRQDNADVNAAKNILAAGLAVTGRGDLAVGRSVKRQPPEAEVA
jgi:hypothetical protein